MENKKYKLVNKNTKQETLCDKVTIEGYDYYVSELKYDGYFTFNDCHSIEPYKGINGEFIVGHGKHHKNICKSVIATNNPSIELPKVVDEYLIIPNHNEDGSFAKEVGFGYADVDFAIGYNRGYNKAKETHPFNKEDMVEFAKFAKSYKSSRNVGVAFAMWKEQQVKTIYYEYN